MGNGQKTIAALLVIAIVFVVAIKSDNILPIEERGVEPTALLTNELNNFNNPNIYNFKKDLEESKSYDERLEEYERTKDIKKSLEVISTSSFENNIYVETGFLKNTTVNTIKDIKMIIIFYNALGEEIHKKHFELHSILNAEQETEYSIEFDYTELENTYKDLKMFTRYYWTEIIL